MFRFIGKLIITAIIFNAILITGLIFLPKEYYKLGIEKLVYIASGNGSTLKLDGDIAFSPFETSLLVINDATYKNPLDGKATLSVTFNSLTFNREEGLHVNAITMDEGKVTYTDSILGKQYTITNINAVMSMENPDAPMNIKGDANAKGQKVNFDVTVASPAELKKGNSVDVVANLATAFMQVKYSAKHNPKDKTKDGKVSLDISSIEKAQQWLTDKADIQGSGTIATDFFIQNNDIATLDGNGRLGFYNLKSKKITPNARQIAQLLLKTSDLTVSKTEGTFLIQDGVITNNDLMGVGPSSSTFSGKGVINLVTKYIDYKVVPNVTVSGAPQAISTIAAPTVAIRGDLMQPVIEYQVQPAAQQIINNLVKNPEAVGELIDSVKEGNPESKELKQGLDGIKKNLEEQIFGKDAKQKIDQLESLKNLFKRP